MYTCTLAVLLTSVLLFVFLLLDFLRQKTKTTASVRLACWSAWVLLLARPHGRSTSADPRLHSQTASPKKHEMFYYCFTYLVDT